MNATADIPRNSRMVEVGNAPPVDALGDQKFEMSPETNLSFDADSMISASAAIRRNWGWLLALPTIIAAFAFAVSSLITPTYTARTSMLAPEKPQSASVAALQSLGALVGVNGSGGGVKTTTDLYASLLESDNVRNRLVEGFDLRKVYGETLLSVARRELDKRVRIVVGKRDGLLTIEVDDRDPTRAAALANRHVDELRRMTSTFAISEAQQRRAFFEQQFKDSQAKLLQAQRALEASGMNSGALKTEPRTAAESYARLRAELTTAQVRLQTLKNSLTDSSPEVTQQTATVAELQGQLARLEQGQRGTGSGNENYVSRYREFKYYETLTEMMARQYEAARVDEARDSATVQVVDVAIPPDRPSKPHKSLIVAAAAVGSFFAALLWLIARGVWSAALPPSRIASARHA